MALAALALVLAAFLAPTQASAQDKLVVSVWGGSWRDMVDNLIGKKFTAATGVPVEYITGGTIDRLNKEKLAKGNPESDITFTTSHVGWLYANDGLYEQLDLAKVPNAKNLVAQAKISPYHIGTWAYVYTIGYRSKAWRSRAGRISGGPRSKASSPRRTSIPVISSSSPRCSRAATLPAGKKGKPSSSS
jgi:spermidine/putrescine-binding protein